MTEETRCGARHAFHPPPEASLMVTMVACSRPLHHAGDHYMRWGGRTYGVEWTVEVTWRHP